MNYRIKDINKNIVSEHETLDEFLTEVSSSISSNELIQYFEYDIDIYERYTSQSFSDETASSLVRITYRPDQDDIEE